MTADLRQFEKVMFKAAQRPVAWLLSAERLREWWRGKLAVGGIAGVL